MSKRLRIGLNIVLALIFAAGIGVLLAQQLRWKDSADSAERAGRMAKFTPPSAAPAQTAPPAAASWPAQPEQATDPVVQALMEVDLDALREVNPDVAGWLYIPGTEISYPILQGADNDYYLKHTWEKKWNGGGSIFLDWRCSRDFGSFNTIIYGHQMNNGTMFASLHLYEDQDFWREYPNVYAAADGGVYRWEVFAAWEAGVTSQVYATGFDTPEERQAFVDLCLEASQIDTGVVPGPEDRLLTLSTCTGSGHAARWVVQARLAEVYDQHT